MLMLDGAKLSDTLLRMNATRFGVLGDIHAEDERLATALVLFAAQRCDQVLFVGDIVDGPGDVERCVTMLRVAKAIGVRGNHERWLLDDTMRTLRHAHHRHALLMTNVEFFEALPATHTITTPRGPMLLCHGVADDDMQRLREHDEGYALQSNTALVGVMRAAQHALLLGGHTHQRTVRRFHANDVLGRGTSSLIYLNPGTLARHDTPCCAILDFADDAMQYYELEQADRAAPSERVPLP